MKGWNYIVRLYRPRAEILSGTWKFPGGSAAMMRFSDTLAADAVDLNFEYIIRVSLYRRHVYAGRPTVRSSILATDSTLIHYGKVHALLTQGSPINVRVFQDCKEAAPWLDVPIDLLTAEAARVKHSNDRTD